MARGPLEGDLSFIQQKAVVPGEVVEEILLPARGYLPGREVKKGQVIRIIDVEGQQVADVILWDASDLEDCSSCTNIMLVHKRWQIGKGDSIWSKYCKKLATIVDDTCGVHWFGGGFCNEEVNAVRYGVHGTVNCRDNLIAAMKGYGLTGADIQVDACFCPFMNAPYAPDGSFMIQEPVSKPGDYIDLLAEMDVILAISNCPSERNPCNAFSPSRLKVVIYNPM
ncbi:MAG: DUF1989 domain-containing protein [Chloroflexi bacterium]|nr:DUF1989 domain-containing protein [Chloroflexota bacterium]